MSFLSFHARRYLTGHTVVEFDGGGTNYDPLYEIGYPNEQTSRDTAEDSWLGTKPGDNFDTPYGQQAAFRWQK